MMERYYNDAAIEHTEPITGEQEITSGLKIGVKNSRRYARLRKNEST